MWDAHASCGQSCLTIRALYRDPMPLRSGLHAVVHDGGIKGGGHGIKRFYFFHLILFLRPRNECTIFLRIFSERFHCQTGACKIFSPVLLRPVRRILLRSIWGAALRDIPKGVIAERTYIMYVARLPYDSCLHRLES